VNSKIVTLKQERDALLNELRELGEWAFGSLVTTKRKSHKGSYPFHYLSRSMNGKNKITYVSKKQLSEMTELIQNGRKCHEILDRISELNIEIIKCK